MEIVDYFSSLPTLFWFEATRVRKSKKAPAHYAIHLYSNHTPAGKPFSAKDNVKLFVANVSENLTPDGLAAMHSHVDDLVRISAVQFCKEITFLGKDWIDRGCKNKKPVNESLT